MKKRLLFLTLNTFSATGGIEKVCRVAGKALHEIAGSEAKEVAVFSMYDRQEQVSEQYLPAAAFKGFSGNKLEFVWQSVQQGRRSEIVLLSHINLLAVGFLIKKFSPKTKLFVMAHGIELWEPLRGLKQKMLKAVDFFLPVSSFTAQKLQITHRIPSSKIMVLNNCLDPFLQRASDPVKEALLRKKHGFNSGDFILMTLTRLKFSEQYKGYDKVVKAMEALKESRPNLKYLIAGKYDVDEKGRIDEIISKAGLQNNVVFAGFVAEEDIAAYFNMADVYIMPSTGEGFGIVFIEALFFGKPVIAGNLDGSVDALAGGKFGLLVNPDSIDEISKSIVTIVNNPLSFIPDIKQVEENFGFGNYKSKLEKLFFANWGAVSKQKQVTTATVQE